ncbi:MAG TPA: ThuA domain-containing protein [Gemmataceae bacterium]|nr:ThuA domain-containing protein [Gemmataceae bacterium]
MPDLPSRRTFLTASAAATAATLLPAAGPRPSDKPVRVVVWDEQQPQQKEAYDNFLGNAIAKYLEGRSGLVVKSVKLDDPEQGLSAEVLGACDVLVWWGHARQAEVKPETGKKLVERVKAGTLGLLALHSAHWSTPFVEAMNERTRQDAERDFRLGGKDKVEITYQAPPQRYTVPKADARLTPYAEQRKYPDGRVKVTVHLPLCCFPAYRADGKPSRMRVLKPGHPLAKGLPAEFELPHTEMYDEPFHVPEPDEVVFEERWAGGEWFRSGMTWRVGKGRVVYFRPGHETFAVYKEKEPLRVIENAVRWLGGAGA